MMILSQTYILGTAKMPGQRTVIPRRLGRIWQRIHTVEQAHQQQVSSYNTFVQFVCTYFYIHFIQTWLTPEECAVQVSTG